VDEPEGILDAVAADPSNDHAWQVLTDWLLENSAPHAVLAAYELQLDRGTRDPELIGDYAEARRERHRLPALMAISAEPIVWKCGYAIEATLRCYPGAPVQMELSRLFGEPAMRALHRVVVENDGWTMSPQSVVPAVFAALPPHVRRVSLNFPRHEAKLSEEAVPEWAFRGRPYSAKQLDLRLGSGRVGGSLSQLAAEGWSTIGLAGTWITDFVQAERAVKRLPDCTFLLGGAFLSKEQARAIDGPNVRWARPGVTAALLAENGALHPLDPSHSDRFVVEHLRLGRDPFGWELLEPVRRRLTHGQAIDARFQYVEVPDVHGWYREYLKA
jgi:hypothetical protein